MKKKLHHDEIEISGNEVELIKTNSFLRWAGSKKKALPKLATFWQSNYKRYVEPFAGSSVLFFKIQPAQAMLGDMNAELIETYGVVRDRPDAVHRAVVELPAGEKHYYRIRQQNPRDLSKFDRAVRFVYLNRYCFNGIYRTNAQGLFNVPFGRQKPSSIPPIETFRKCALLLKRADLRACDFGHVLRDTRAGDFVYLDPPYAVESRRIFHEYGPRQFNKKDLNRLADHLQRMNERDVHFVVSYADCAEARQSLKEWAVTRIRVRRHIAGFAGSRRTAYELVATNISKRGR